MYLFIYQSIYLINYLTIYHNRGTSLTYPYANNNNFYKARCSWLDLDEDTFDKVLVDTQKEFVCYLSIYLNK
jgi:hypothetical protein